MNITDSHGPSMKSLALSSLILLPLCLGVAGCISSSNPPPPANTTVVVPNGAVVTCTDGTAPPCR
jgi:hypothetical protein